jgi:hypothetical protein
VDKSVENLNDALTLQVIDAYLQIIPEHGHGLYALASAAAIDCHTSEKWFSFAPDRQRVIHAQAHDSATATAIDAVDL